MRNVEDPVAHGLRLGLGQCAVEADHLAPGQECPGDEGGGHPGLVADEGVEGQVGQTTVLPVPDPVLDPGVSPVTELEGGDVSSLGVGDEAGVAEALCRVEEVSWAPGWGRSRRMNSRAVSGMRQAGSSRSVR